MMRDAQTFEPQDARVTRPAFWRALGATWTGDEEETLVCCQVRQETHDVKSFFFMSKEGRTFSFEPGQFITLELEIDGETINRCYTISSAPTRPHTISITAICVRATRFECSGRRASSPARVMRRGSTCSCRRAPALRR